MVEIQGKLLTKEMKEAMDLFVEKREVVNINPANPYLFERASATSVNQLGSWGCLQKLANAEGLNLQSSQAITSTR